jgi:hypothetical protein
VAAGEIRLPISTEERRWTAGRTSPSSSEAPPRPDRRLLVAVSIKIDVIGRSMELRNRAAQILVLFINPLVAAVLLAVPEQPIVALGIELIALGVIAGAAAGFYFLVPAFLAAITGGVINAWLFLTKTTD